MLSAVCCKVLDPSKLLRFPSFHLFPLLSSPTRCLLILKYYGRSEARPLTTRRHALSSTAISSLTDASPFFFGACLEHHLSHRQCSRYPVFDPGMQSDTYQPIIQDKSRKVRCVLYSIFTTLLMLWSAQKRVFLRSHTSSTSTFSRKLTLRYVFLSTPNRFAYP